MKTIFSSSLILILIATLVPKMIQAESAYPAKGQAKVIKLSDMLPRIKSLGSAQNIMKFSQCLAPELKFSEWHKYAVSKNAPLKNIILTDIRVTGDKIFLPGIKNSFRLTQIQNEIEYQGVKFKFDFAKGPEHNFKMFSNKFGIFKELAGNSSVSFFSLLIPTAYAESGTGLVESFMKLASLFGAKSAAESVSTRTASFGSFDAIIEVGIEMYNRFVTGKNHFSGIELKCDNPPYLEDYETKENVTAKVLSHVESRTSRDALRVVCESPERADAFNKSLFFVKKMVMNAELDKESLERAQAAHRAYLESLPKSKNFDDPSDGSAL